MKKKKTDPNKNVKRPYEIKRITRLIAATEHDPNLCVFASFFYLLFPLLSCSACSWLGARTRRPNCTSRDLTVQFDFLVIMVNEMRE